MKIKEIGNGSIKVCIIGAMHGNEHIGARVIKLLSKDGFDGVAVKTIIANEKAMDRNVRFIDSDLNRVFPGKRYGNSEERLAYRITNEIKDCDFSIDIHSTYASMPDTIITTKRSAFALARKVPLTHTVLMEPVIAQGKSLIDYAKTGVSLEFNRARTPKHVHFVIKRTIMNIKSNSDAKMTKKIYAVYGTVPKFGKPAGIKNLEPVKKGQVIAIKNGRKLNSREHFYPVLLGEPAYDMLCMKAKRVATCL